jgi:hypothetical protein
MPPHAPATRILRLALTALCAFALSLAMPGCIEREPQYGQERIKYLQTKRRQVWAVAPVINLSGEQGVDPFLQADLVFQQLQQVQGVTAVPVNRVAEVYATLRIQQVSSAEQAALVCDLLQCDGLLVTSVTIFDPYNPPKLGGAMQLFIKPSSYARPVDVDPRELARRATPKHVDSIPTTNGSIAQVVGMYDGANGTVRDALHRYAAGRNDPLGPLGEKEYFVNMDRYCGFVYADLIERLITSPKLNGL